MKIKEIENALKLVYLDIIRYQLNDADLVSSKIAKTSEGVYGKEIIIYKTINNKDYTFKSDLKNIYASIELSDKVIRCSTTSSTLVELLNNEIETMLGETKNHLLNAFYNEDIELPFYNEESYTPLKLNGLKYLFDNNEKYLYEVERESNKEILPVIKKVKSFNWNKIQQLIDEINPDIDCFICNAETKRSYAEYMQSKYQNIEYKEINNHKYMLFQQCIPIIVNNQLSSDEIYLINTKDFKFHQLCDWLWLEDYENRILKVDKQLPKYKATLVKYGDYICHEPQKQIKIVKGEII